MKWKEKEKIIIIKTEFYLRGKS